MQVAEPAMAALVVVMVSMVNDNSDNGNVFGDQTNSVVLVQLSFGQNGLTSQWGYGKRAMDCSH